MSDRALDAVLVRSIAGAAAATLVVDGDGRIIEANDAAAEVFGWTCEELRARSVEDLMPAAVRAAHARQRIEYAVAPTPRPMGCGRILRALRRDGSEFAAEVGLLPVVPNRVLTTVVDVSQALRERELLREREALLRQFIERAPAALAMFDDEMRYLAASERWMRDFGLEGRDLLGQSHYDVYPDMPQRWREVHRRCLAGATERSEEDRFDRADGSVLWLRWEAQPWYDAAGAVRGIVIFSDNITKRKAAEIARDRFHREIEEQQALLRSVINSVPVALALFAGRDLRYVLANRSHESIAPAAGPLGGRRFDDVWQGGAGSGLRRLLQRVLDHGEPVHAAHVDVGRRDTAGPRDAIFDVTCLPVEGGQLGEPGALLVAQNITEQVAARRRIEESEQWFRATFEQAGLGIAHMTPEGKCLRVNDALCAMVGAKPDQLVDCSFDDVVDPRDAEPDAPLRERLLAGRIQQYALPVRLRRRDGGETWASLTMAVVRNADGTPRYLLAMFQDLTETRRNEKTLHELRRNIERMQTPQVAFQTAMALAHDLNQPLNALTTYAEAARRLLRQADPPQARVVRTLEAISTQAKRAGEVVRELLRFIQQGPGEQQEVDLKAIVEESLAIVESHGYDGTATQIVCAPAVPAVLVNRLQIQKALVNLIRNGIEAMVESGIENKSIAVSLSALPGGDAALVTVTDAGTGMDAATAARAFEPFFTSKRSGIGMGLAISRALIEVNGGHLWFDEQAPGPGATFRFTLPLAPARTDATTGVAA